MMEKNTCFVWRIASHDPELGRTRLLIPTETVCGRYEEQELEFVNREDALRVRAQHAVEPDLWILCTKTETVQPEALHPALQKLLDRLDRLEPDHEALSEWVHAAHADLAEVVCRNGSEAQLRMLETHLGHDRLLEELTLLLGLKETVSMVSRIEQRLDVQDARHILRNVECDVHFYCSICKKMCPPGYVIELCSSMEHVRSRCCISHEDFEVDWERWLLCPPQSPTKEE